MTADARTIARRWFEEVWNARRDEAIDELMSTESIGYVEGGVVRGPDGFRQMYTMFLRAVPDIRIDIEEILGEGERAAVRWRARGTHTGEGFGFPPTGRPVDITGTSWMVARNGQLVEGRDTWNLHGMLASLQTQADAKAEKLF
jgi:steroid delta-isomerase-like uncharacterized protein